MRTKGKRATFIESMVNSISDGKLVFIPCTLERKNEIVRNLKELDIQVKASASYKRNEKTGINEITESEIIIDLGCIDGQQPISPPHRAFS